jgi:hypothetical protein
MRSLFKEADEGCKSKKKSGKPYERLPDFKGFGNPMSHFIRYIYQYTEQFQ